MVVSAFIARALSVPGIILEEMLRAGFPYLVSVDLLAEYRRALLRPRIQRRHTYGAADIDRVIADIARGGREVEHLGDTDAPPPDPGDLHLWRLLASVEDGVLVTGDRALVDNPPSFARVVTPRQFLQMRQLEAQRRN